MANGHGGARPGAGRKRKNPIGPRDEFSPEQLKVLLESPHVSYVSRTTVSFTAVFKEMCWQRYIDGVEPLRIFTEANLPVDLLGRSRIAGFFKLMRKQKEKGLPFNEGNEPNEGQPEKKLDFPIPPKKISYKTTQLSDADIVKMQHQVAYMSQELEFIKKIILAGTEGRSKK